MRGRSTDDDNTCWSLLFVVVWECEKNYSVMLLYDDGSLCSLSALYIIDILENDFDLEY